MLASAWLLGCAQGPSVRPWDSTFGYHASLSCEQPPPRCALATDSVADVAPMTYCAFYASKRGVKRWLVEVDYATTDCDLQRMLCKAHGVLVSWSRAESKGLVIFPSTPQAASVKSLREELKVVSVVDEYGNGYAHECSWNQHRELH